MISSLEDVMSELKLLKNLMNESAEKAATKEDLSNLKAIRATKPYNTGL